MDAPNVRASSTVSAKPGSAADAPKSWTTFEDYPMIAPLVLGDRFGGAALADRGGDQGVVLVGLFGHGIEFSRTRKSYFCPWDTPVQAVRDLQGNPLFDDNGKPKFEPVAAKLVAMDDFLIALRESKAAHRVLLADCCRNDPNVARGRSFGSSLETNQLPKNTAVLFACSEGQKAFEHSDWGHGAFTKVALEVLRSHAAQGKTTMGSIAEEIGPAVEQMTKTKLRDDEQAQTPRLLLTGTRIDLMLAAPVDFVLATTSLSLRTTRGTTRTRVANRIQWESCVRTPGGYTTCTAMFGNGLRIGTTRG
jgi:hypothetical protein